MWSSRLTEDQKQAILDAYLANNKVKDIAKLYGVHHSYPTLLARRRGVETRAGLSNIRYPKENTK